MIDQLVQKFLSQQWTWKMGNAKLAKRWKVTQEQVEEARNRARKLTKADHKATTGNYVADLEEEIFHLTDNEKGTLTSTTTSKFDPKNDAELAELHKVDLTKYKISTYWSKLKPSGKFTSSVMCTLRKMKTDEGLQSVSLKEVLLKELFPDPDHPQTIQGYETAHRSRTGNNGKALLIITSDEHIAAANLRDDLYNIHYDGEEYRNRKRKILQTIAEEVRLHGKFDTCYDIKLGDDLDGWNGGTTRQGEGHNHVLPQNMDNKEALQTYVRTNISYWNDLMGIDPADRYVKYDIVNSNHGGKGLDYAANLGVEVFLETKYPSVNIEYIHKLIGHFSYGPHTVLLTHGKDENYMKKGLPLNLEPKTEIFVKQYMDHHKIHGKTTLLKGDLHQFNWNAGKFFDYINVGSVYGSSGWVQANYGLTNPSFAIGVLDHVSGELKIWPVYL